MIGKAHVYWSDRRQSWVASLHSGAWVNEWLYPTWRQAFDCAFFQVSLRAVGR